MDAPDAQQMPLFFSFSALKRRNVRGVKPDLFVAFAPVEIPAPEVVRRLLAVVERHQGQLDEHYFAQVTQDSDGDFCVTGERLNVGGRDEVLALLDDNGGGEISCDLPLFSNENIYLLGLVDRQDTSALVHISASTSSGRLADFIEGKSFIVEPVADLFEEFAQTLGAHYFVYGSLIDTWSALTKERIYAGPNDEFWPYSMAWSHDALSRDQLEVAWRVAETTGSVRDFRRVSVGRR